MTDGFLALHRTLWHDLRAEVQAAYERQAGAA